MNIIKWISGFLCKMSYAYTSLTEQNYLANTFSNSDNSEQPLANSPIAEPPPRHQAAIWVTYINPKPQRVPKEQQSKARALLRLQCSFCLNALGLQSKHPVHLQTRFWHHDRPEHSLCSNWITESKLLDSNLNWTHSSVTNLNSSQFRLYWLRSFQMTLLNTIFKWTQK